MSPYLRTIRKVDILSIFIEPLVNLFQKFTTIKGFPSFLWFDIYKYLNIPYGENKKISVLKL